MITVFILFFMLIHDESSPVVYIEMLKSSTIRLAIYVDFSKAESSSTLTHFHDFDNFVRMKRIIHTGSYLGEVLNIQGIIIFLHTTVSI